MTTNDLVKRLRLPVEPEYHDPFKSGHWCRIHTQVLDAIGAERKEAADEIKRLRNLLMKACELDRVSFLDAYEKDWMNENT